MTALSDPPRQLLIRDFDFESKPLWFWYEKPTAVLTSLSYMDIVGPDIKHDTMRTEIAPLDTRESYREWLLHVRELLMAPDMLTGHNINQFDLPLLQAQLMRHGLPGLSDIQTHDTKNMPKRRDMSISQENLLNYEALRPVCPIGMPIYKHHLSISEWEDAAMGWADDVLTERPQSDVHSHAHMREVLMARGYLAFPSKWTSRGDIGAYAP